MVQWPMDLTLVMPSEFMMSVSSELSSDSLTSPSTSAGVKPQSSRAAAIASTARRSSLRPELRENSVCPIPTMAALSRKKLLSTMKLRPPL